VVASAGAIISGMMAPALLLLPYLHFAVRAGQVDSLTRPPRDLDGSVWPGFQSRWGARLTGKLFKGPLIGPVPGVDRYELIAAIWLSGRFRAADGVLAPSNPPQIPLIAARDRLGETDRKLNFSHLRNYRLENNKATFSHHQPHSLGDVRQPLIPISRRSVLHLPETSSAQHPTLHDRVHARHPDAAEHDVGAFVLGNGAEQGRGLPIRVSDEAPRDGRGNAPTATRRPQLECRCNIS
jgi:hypothetical protein